MKKFQFAAGLLAMGLLASCSSDAPEAPVPANGAEQTGETRTLALRLNTATRADQNLKDEETGVEYKYYENESRLNNLRIFLVDASNNLVFDESFYTANVQTDDDGTLYALFEVNEGLYGRLSNYKTADITVKVVANYENIATSDAERTGAYGNDVEVSQLRRTDGTAFVMSGSARGKFTSTVTKRTLNGAQQDVWILNDGDDAALKINLKRLATRFDLTTPATKDFTIENTSTKVNIVEGWIDTRETTTFMWQRTTGTGITPWNNKHEKPSINMNAYSTTSGSHKKMVYGNPTYTHPHYVSDLKGTEDCKDPYHRASFAVFKAEFSNEDLITASKDVYVFDGILLGSFEKLHAGKTLTDYGLTSSAATATLEEILTSAKNTDEAAFKKNFEKATLLKTFTADANGKCVCYYNSIIVNGTRTYDETTGKLNVTNDNVDILRNQLYTVGVSKITRIGSDGNNPPTDDHETEKTFWIQLDVNVQNWEVIPANNAMEF